MVSIFPPALPYQKPPKTDRAFTVSKVMWERATAGYFLFDEDQVIMKNQELCTASCLVIDIKRYNFKSKAMSHFGFSILPLV